jgi:amino acid permease
MKKEKSKLFPAVATLTGTIIGAGFLGIPYVVWKSGFLAGLFYIIVIGLIMLFVRLLLGEVILRTKGNHQLVGYAQKYLGKKGKYLILFSMIFGIYSALLAYVIGEGKSLSFLFFGDDSFTLFFGILFWIIASALTFKGLKALKRFQPIALIIVLITILIIIFYYSPEVKINNLSSLNLEFIFLPFGVILFSMLGTASMPEVERILSNQENKLKKAIIIGGLIPIIVYSLFAFIVVGKFDSVPEIATLALGKIFIFLGVLTMFTAFFALTLAIRDMFRFDFGIKRFYSWVLASFIPLVLFLIVYNFNLLSFISILAIGGSVAGGVEIISILFMAKNAKKKGNRKPEYKIPICWFIIILLSLIFIAGILLEVWRLI